MSPQTVKHKFTAGGFIDDLVIQNPKTVTEVKSLYLYLQQCIHRLFDFVLYLPGAKKPQLIVISKEYSEPGGIP